jgi:hypothetical protein
MLFATGAGLMVLPAAIISLSHEYQRNLRLGYIQGHICTFDIQVGFLTLFFASCALLALRWQRLLSQLALSLLLATLCTLTLAYNLLNRDGMAANNQRWAAFALLVEALPDGTTVSAPSFWWGAGVSEIPGGLTFGMTNYWTERARIWHGKRILVTERDAKPAPGGVRASYGVRPEGQPIVMLRDGNGAHLLAGRPLAVDQVLTDGAEWRCGRFCQLDLEADPDADGEAHLLASPRIRTLGLLRWFGLPRSGAFGSG